MEKLLASILAPQCIDDVIGQKHLLGENKILRNLIENKKLFSMILYGRPGIGKTSIAKAIVNTLKIRYRFLNATINNKKDFDVVVEEAKMYDGIVLIMDEIHRLNKDKQDLLLPALESGLITLIGMTTANPFHAINPAIRSRCQLFELHELDDDDIMEGLKRAVQNDTLDGIIVDDGCLEYITKLSANDLRFAYNLLEVAFYSTKDKHITMDVLTSINNKPAFFHDKDGDGYYDVLSAFQKSIRGSDVNASLHYLARLIVSGDLESIFRRMAVIAYEDIGLANPSIGPKVMAAIEACRLTGLPEARIPLGTIVVEMALSPKSNTAHIALDEAIRDVETGRCGAIPEYLRGGGTSDYKYPHDYKGSYIPQQYLPDNLKHKKYYNPKNESKFECSLYNIDKYLDKIKKDNNVM